MRLFTVHLSFFFFFFCMLFIRFIQNLTNCHRHGETVQSSHQVVYDLYRDIQSGFLKSYITAQMSYMILGYYNNGGKFLLVYHVIQSIDSSLK